MKYKYSWCHACHIKGAKKNHHPLDASLDKEFKLYLTDVIALNRALRRPRQNPSLNFVLPKK
jgi:hypothetical protein